MADQIEEFEYQISTLKVAVEKADLAEKLARNSDFRKLIMDGFCTTEAARLVAESADPSFDEKQQADALSMAQAGGHLKRYLQFTIRMGKQAEKSITDYETAIEELRAAEQPEVEGLE